MIFISEHSVKKPDMNDGEMQEKENPPRSRVLLAILIGAVTVFLFSSFLLILVYTDDLFFRFFLESSVGIGGFALSILMVFIWIMAGIICGIMLGTGIRLGFLCGLAAGFLGQGIVAIALLFVESPRAFPLHHHVIYALLGALITGFLAAVITYNRETILLLQEMEKD